MKRNGIGWKLPSILQWRNGTWIQLPMIFGTGDWIIHPCQPTRVGYMATSCMPSSLLRWPSTLPEVMRIPAGNSHKMLHALISNDYLFFKCCHMAVLHAWNPLGVNIEITVRPLNRWTGSTLRKFTNLSLFHSAWPQPQQILLQVPWFHDPCIVSKCRYMCEWYWPHLTCSYNPQHLITSLCHSFVRW